MVELIVLARASLDGMVETIAVTAPMLLAAAIVARRGKQRTPNGLDDNKSRLKISIVVQGLPSLGMLATSLVDVRETLGLTEMADVILCAAVAQLSIAAVTMWFCRTASLFALSSALAWGAYSVGAAFVVTNFQVI